MRLVYDIFNDYKVRNLNNLLSTDQKANPISEDDKNIIIDRFIDLFKAIFNISLSKKEIFISSFGISNINSKVTFKFIFKYGHAYVDTNNENFKIKIFIDYNKRLVLPFCSELITIDCDHNFNLLEARVSKHSKFKNYYNESCFDFYIFSISRIITISETYNLIEIQNILSKDNQFIKFNNSDISSKYFEMDLEFEFLFCKFVDLYKENSDLFDDIFYEFDGYIDSKKQDSIFKFLNKFSDLYQYDIELLKSKLLIIDIMNN